MTEKNRQRFHHAVDTALSGLEGDPMLAQRIILQARPKEEPRMNKKISVGFVIVLAMLLMSVMDIASSLRVAQSTVSTRLKRAREKLREVLEGGDHS